MGVSRNKEGARRVLRALIDTGLFSKGDGGHTPRMPCLGHRTGKMLESALCGLVSVVYCKSTEKDLPLLLPLCPLSPCLITLGRKLP